MSALGCSKLAQKPTMGSHNRKWIVGGIDIEGYVHRRAGVYDVMYGSEIIRGWHTALSKLSQSIVRYDHTSVIIASVCLH